MKDETKALSLDTRVELTNDEIAAILKEKGGAVISSKQMQALAAIGFQLETFGAIRTVQGDAIIARSALRSFLLRLHDLCETADLATMVEAAGAIAKIHKQFNESMRVSREMIETQQGNARGVVMPPRPVMSFPTGPIQANTVIVNTGNDESKSQQNPVAKPRESS